MVVLLLLDGMNKKKPLLSYRRQGLERKTDFLFQHSLIQPLLIRRRRAIRRRPIRSRIRAARSAPSIIMAVSAKEMLLKNRLFITKKTGTADAVPGGLSGVVWFSHQPHDETARTSRISSSPGSVIRLIRICFIQISAPFLRFVSVI